MSTRYNGIPNAYNAHRKTCDSVGVPYKRSLKTVNRVCEPTEISMCNQMVTSEIRE